MSSARCWSQRCFCISCLAPWVQRRGKSAAPGTAPVQTRCRPALLACSQCFVGPSTCTATFLPSLDEGTHQHTLHRPITLCSAVPEGKRRSVTASTLVEPQSQRLFLAKSLAQAHGTMVLVEMEDVSDGLWLQRRVEIENKNTVSLSPCPLVHPAAPGGVTGQHP